MARILHLDFETRSDVDLRKCGLHVYARGKNTSVLCMAWAFDDGPVETWRAGDYAPFEVIEHIKCGGEVWAHNAAFERELWNNRFWPGVPLCDEQLVCTMAMAYAMGLPGTLEGAAAALGVDKQKDLEGGRIMRVLSTPKAINPDGTPTWWEDERINRLVAYCAQDVEVERAIGHRMLKLSPHERNVWLLDQKINQRGIAVDVKAVKAALILVETEKERLNVRMREVTSNKVATCNATQQIKDYLEVFGVDAESISKADVVDFLADPNLPPKAREVLELRSMGAKAATAKLDPMLGRASSQGRLQGAFQYSGAGTRRWAGRGVQLQNLKRPTMKHSLIESLVGMISSGMSAEAIEMIFGSPLTIISDCIRAMLVAGPGKDLIVADFSAIEARVLAWLAGQENILEVFRSGDDIYKVAARDIFRTKEISSDHRQVGKVAILALGYQGGVGAFQQMAKGYNVKMAPAYPGLWNVATHEQREKAEANWDTNKKKAEISREEFIASDLVKIAWREANPKIVEYWYDAETAMIEAISKPGATSSFGPVGRKVQFKTNGSFLWCKMPSGGVNCYPYPELKATKTPWGATKELPTYMSEDSQSRKWVRYTTYGGSIVENICQSVARDLLAEAMLRLETAGYPVVAHVHDEIICEMPEGEGSLEEMSLIMAEVPSWASGLPLAAAGFRGKRYRK